MGQDQIERVDYNVHMGIECLKKMFIIYNHNLKC